MNDRSGEYWKRVSAAVRGTHLYQVFVVRAMRRRTSVAWYLISGWFAIMALTWGIEAMNPVLDLDQMGVASGVVEKVGDVKRGCCDKLYLRTNDGELKKYDWTIYTEEVESLIGKKVTVWSQRNISVFGPSDYIYQIKLDNHFVKDYREIKVHRENARDGDPWIFGMLSTLALFPLLRIWWVNRKYMFEDRVK